MKEMYTMTQSKSQQERQWTNRKQAQNPHGKVESFDQHYEDVKDQKGKSD